MRVMTNNVEWMSGTQTVEKVAAQLCGGRDYCPACVECESPAIDANAVNVQRGGAVSVCTCCGTDYNA